MESLATLENYTSRAGEGKLMDAAEPWGFYKRYASNYGNWKLTEGVKQFQEAEKQYLRANILEGSRVIDIGCGPGEHLASIRDKRCAVTAVDFVQEMIDIARARVGYDIEFICDDIKDLRFPKDHFDFGICYCTLPNQEDYALTFDKISYYSRSLIISVYNWESRNEIIEFYLRNGLHPETDIATRSIVVAEGMRYVLIPEDVVVAMYEKNGYQTRVNRHKFGNIYHGER